MMIKLGRTARDAVLIILVAVASITVSLLVTPLQQTSAAGQTIRVGVATPTLGLSGPGELDLFGQRLPTTVQFLGPVRPRVQLSRITLSQQLSDFVNTAGGSGTRQIESALVHGWWHYFAWQLVIVAAVALVLLGAVAGWRRKGRRATTVFVAAGLAVIVAMNSGAVMVTAFTAPHRLSQVTSLEALVGSTPQPPAAARTGSGSASPSAATDVVVIGDSTAAGLGNPLVSRANKTDQACGRSQDSFAADLADTAGWKVTNLACSGATIADGLLGPQTTHGLSVPAQLSDPAITTASTILVSIGANDVHWSNMLQVCAASPTCQDDAEEAYFQQQIAGFSRDYLQLLTQLATLPSHPHVVVNLYYNPFIGDDRCLVDTGVTRAKQQAMTAKLAALNDVLAAGAKATEFSTATPDFTDHGLCSDSSYIQGPTAGAPFHPTPAGQLAIALADAEAITTPPSA